MPRKPKRSALQAIQPPPLLQAVKIAVRIDEGRQEKRRRFDMDVLYQRLWQKLVGPRYQKTWATRRALYGGTGSTVRLKHWHRHRLNEMAAVDDGSPILSTYCPQQHKPCSCEDVSFCKYSNNWGEDE
jgi:hypothetical protein